MIKDGILHFQLRLAEITSRLFNEIFKQTINSDLVAVNVTPKEFEGDFTIVTFPLARFSKLSPPETAEKLGASLIKEVDWIQEYNVVKGFLNVTLSDEMWIDFLNASSSDEKYGFHENRNQQIVLEYCGPNTNKPLHLGHIRNMLIGSAVSNILEADGYNLARVNIYNDRGIAICKSMVAWLREGNGATPESTGKKGDHFVGDYYVRYSQILERETEGKQDKKEAEKSAPIYLEAQEMLLKWEAGDPETIKLWERMNGWVYAGFEETFKKLDARFDKAYYESETYLDGKQIVEEGLASGHYFKKEDGSVWVDLTEDGLDEKVLIRSDGTAVYLTQDLGTAQHRYNDYKMDRSIYVVANEQDYHFRVLKLALQKLGKVYADGIYHLSYGMVDLPTGKMKSREGTTVDADDLVDSMVETAARHTKELGKIEELKEDEAQKLYEVLGLGMAAEEEPQFEFYTSRLGIRFMEIIPFYIRHLKKHEHLKLKMLHFFIDTGIKDESYYWTEFHKALDIYCALKKICPSLDSLNIGGGMPIKQSLGFDFDYTYMIDEIVHQIKSVCKREKVKEPHIFTEFGSFTVGESGANIYSVLGQKQQNDKELWYMIDNSLITTLPDIWGMNHRFVLLPLNHWDNKYTRVKLGGMTCDIMDYYSSEAHVGEVYLPEINKNDKLYVGFFHTGAYQESISGFGGIKHCLIPNPKVLLIDKVKSKITYEVFTEEQTSESMLKILGY